MTSVSMRNATWMDGVQVNAQDLRLQAVAGRLTGASPTGSTGIAARPGVRYGTGDPLKVAASSGMNITVSAGFVYVQGTVSATAGMYEGCLDTTSTLTVTTSDPTNPRIDNVIAKFVDNGDNTSTGTITIQAGTPAASPVAPTLPANSLLLATIAVGANVSSITAGNITDGRVWTVGVGGILPMKDVAGGITGPAGLYVDDLSTGRLKRSDGSGNARSPKIAPFAPQTYRGNQTATVGSSLASPVVTLSVACDGATEVECRITWSQLAPGTGTSSDQVTIQFYLNGTPFGDTCNLYPHSSGYISGGSFFVNTTPAAGTAVFGLNFSGSGTSGHTFTFQPLSFRVSAFVGS